MTEIVRWLLGTTPLLTFQLLLVLLIGQAVRKHFGARLAYQLWAFPLAWLLSSWVINTMSNQWLQSTLQVESFQFPQVSELLSTSSIMVLPMMDYPAAEDILWKTLSWLWLAGFASAFLIFVSRASQFQEYFNTQGKRCTSERIRRMASAAGFPKTLPIVLLEKGSSPALYGVVEHCLFLPEDFLSRYSKGQQVAVLSHEHVHYRRKDNPLNFLAQLLCMVFWFNPVIHLAYRSYRLDQEISCDHLVLAGATPKRRLDYAEALFCSVSGRQYQALGVSSWGGGFLKYRTRMLNSAHLVVASKRAKATFLTSMLIVGTLASSAIHSNEHRAPKLLDSELLPESLRETLTRLSQLRANPASPQPIKFEYGDDHALFDSEYLIFIVDTSSEAIDSNNWHSLINRISELPSQYKNLQGLQVLSGEGDYLNTALERQWITYDPETLQNIHRDLLSWENKSSGSPVEGIREAVNNLVAPGQSVSVYVIGNNLGHPVAQTASEIDQIMSRASISPEDVKFHTLMIPTYMFDNSSRGNQTSAYNYLSLMYGISQGSGGTFELYGIY